MRATTRDAPVGWRRFAILSILLTGALLLNAGCGYRPAGMSLPGAAEGPITLAVPLWENRSGELGLAPMLRGALVSRLQQSAAVRLTENRPPADASRDAVPKSAAPLRLTGRILAMRRQPVAYDSHDQARQVRYRLTVDAALLAPDGRQLWRLDRLDIEETYPVAGNALQTRSARWQALARICTDLADEIALRLLEAASAAPLQAAAPAAGRRR